MMTLPSAVPLSINDVASEYMVVRAYIVVGSLIYSGFFMPDRTMLTPVSSSTAVPIFMYSGFVAAVTMEPSLPLEYSAALKSYAGSNVILR